MGRGEAAAPFLHPWLYLAQCLGCCELPYWYAFPAWQELEAPFAKEEADNSALATTR